jgi:transposase
MVVNKIILHLRLNQSQRCIAKELKVARSTVQRIQLNVDLFGEPYAPPSVKLGRPRSFTTEQEECTGTDRHTRYAVRVALRGTQSSYPTPRTFDLWQGKGR